MATRNRKPNREQSPGLEPFLGGSLAVHGLLALVLAGLLAPAVIPAPPEPVPDKPAEEVVVPPVVEPEDPRVAAATEEIRKVAREELAREQLKPAFDKLVGGALPPNEIESLWNALLDDLDTGLDNLVELLEIPQFDAGQFDQKVQQLREALLRKLEEKLRAAEAKALAEPLKKALEEQVGKPLGDALKQALEAEQREGLALLQKAALDLTAAAKTTRAAEEALKQSGQNFEQARRDLEAATAKNDAKAQQQTQAKVRTEQAKLTAAQKQLELARTQTEAVARTLQERHPELATPIKDAGKQVEAGKELVPEAVKQAAQGKAELAAQATRQARERTEQAAAALEKLAEATRLQGAREQVAKAAREIEEARRAEDPGKPAEKAEATVRAVVPALEQGKQEAAGNVKAAQQKLEQARADVAAKLPQQARTQLKDAQAKLDAAEGQLRREQEKLGIRPANPAEAVLARVTEQANADLAKKIEAKLQPQLERKLDPKVVAEMKKLEPGKIVAAAAKERLPEVKNAPSSGPHAEKQAQKVEAAALAQLDKLVGTALGEAVKQGQAALAGQPGTNELLRRVASRLESAGHQASPFGAADGAGAAALRARLQHTRNSIGGLRHHWDGAAYKRMMEHLKDRDPVTGEIVARAGVTGPGEKAGPEVGLKPAYVGFSAAVASEPPAPKSERRLPEPNFRTHRFGGIPLLTDETITLDGDLTDWKDLPSLQLHPVLKGAGKSVKARPDKQIAYAAWCPKGLLLAFDVEDTSLAAEYAGPIQAFWMLDCVEIYLDTMNTKASKRGETHTHQFFVFPFGHKDQPERGGFEAFVQGDGIRIVPYDRDTIRRAAKQTANGWTLEILISKEVLRNADLAPGRVVGFNLQVDTGTDLYYYWTAAERFMTSMHPNTWGDLQLLGSDAKVTFVDEGGKASVEALIPGKTLRVRVEDPDMNVDPGKKDRIGLTLRTASGQTRTVVLEETTANSGTFTGSLATTLNIGGEGPPLALPVFEGETITAEFLDQVRAFGERNQKVTAKLPVASLGTQSAQ